MRLIDADELSRRIGGECADSVVNGVSQLYREGLLTAKMLMDRCKTVDAVQIVRCDDCKYWAAIESEENDCDCYGVCQQHDRITKYDDFCQCGTKENGNEQTD